MNRTVIYARVSTEDQLEKYGLSSQLRACREFAASHLNIIEEITDDGVSGVVLSRPGLDRLRRMVRDCQVDVVLMFDTDRLSRELAHLLILKPEIERHARLEFVASKFEDSPSGRMFFGIRGVIAQYEREQTRERTMRGKRERALSGLIVGGRVAYGYNYAGGELTEEPVRADVVRQIFSFYESGSSLRGITSRLRESNTPTWGGSSAWGKSSVRRILANETYAGVAHYGTHRREGSVLKIGQLSERISMAVPALISHEQWEHVQSRLSANPMVGRPSTSYLLRGLLHCSCGRKMYSDSKRRDRSYRCAGRDRLQSGIPCRSRVDAKAMDSAVWRALSRTFSDSLILRQAIEQRQEELKSGAADLDDMRKRAAKLKRREDTAISAMLDPDLASSRATIKAEYKAVSADRRRIEAEISTLERSQDRYGSTDWIDDTVAMVREFILGADEQQRQEFVRRLVSRAEWNGEGVRMECLISPKLATSSTRCSQFTALQVVVFERVAA